jgi:hypothetical protein
MSRDPPGIHCHVIEGSSATGGSSVRTTVKGTTPSNSVGRESVIKTAKVASVSSVGGRVSVSTTTKEASADPGGSGNVQ